VAEFAGREGGGAPPTSLLVKAHYKGVEHSPSDPDLWIYRRRSVESFVNDLLVGRGVVLGRAVFTLRSIETHPLTRDSSFFIMGDLGWFAGPVGGAPDQGARYGLGPT